VKVLRALGIVNPTVRELVELQYEFQEPFIVDSTKIAAKLVVHATPLDQALADTLAKLPHPNPSSASRRGSGGRCEDLGRSRPLRAGPAPERRAPTWMHQLRRPPAG